MFSAGTKQTIKGSKARVTNNFLAVAKLSLHTCKLNFCPFCCCDKIRKFHAFYAFISMYTTSCSIVDCGNFEYNCNLGQYNENIFYEKLALKQSSIMEVIIQVN